jgi:hypothetical protein
MKRHGWVLWAMLLGGALAGCSRNQAPAQTVASVPAEVQPDAMEELKKMDAELRAQLDNVLQPVKEVDALISEVGTMPARLRIDPTELHAVLVAKFSGTGVNLTGELADRQKVKIQIDVLLARVDGVVWGLKAMPSRAAALAQTCGAAVAKLPVLANKANAQAQATLKDPLAKSEDKARAKADMASLGKVQSDVQATIEQVQSTANSLSSLANEALAKLTTNFAS